MLTWKARSVARIYDIHKLEGCCCYNVGYVAGRGILPSLKADRDSSISVPPSPEAPEVLTDLL